MRYGIAVTEVPAAKPAFRPSWALIGLVAAGTVLVIILAVIVVKVVAATPQPRLGVTASDELQPGSCLDEGAVDLDQYTVVDCGRPHPQQIVASIDLGKSENVYTQYDAMSSYAQEICDRLIEYRLYLREGPSYDRYELVVVAMPTQAQFDEGRQFALCAIVDPDGDDLTESFYRAMP